MADPTEFSWPFDKGDGTNVSQDRWQDMTARMSPSAVSGRLGDDTLQVVVSSAQTSAVDIRSGEAMVRGFAYRTTGVTVQLEDNTPNPNPRVDVIVLRLDMKNNHVTAAALKGQPAPTPSPRQLTQIHGDVWEFPLANVLIKKASNVIDTITDCRMFTDSGRLPQSADPAKAVPIPTPGDFMYQRDSGGMENLSAYANRGGWAIIQDLGKSRTYTPTLNGASAGSPKPILRGHWKWIAQNVAYFTATVQNPDPANDIKIDPSGSFLSVNLPVKSRSGYQIVNSVLLNNTNPQDQDNYWIGNAYMSGGTTVQPVFQNPHSLAATGDWLDRIPHAATLIINGVFEADVFNEGNN